MCDLTDSLTPMRPHPRLPCPTRPYSHTPYLKDNCLGTKLIDSLSGRGAAWFSASVLGTEGRWFESTRPDHFRAPIAQADRAQAF